MHFAHVIFTAARPCSDLLLVPHVEKFAKDKTPGKHCDVARSSQVTFDLSHPQFTVMSAFIRLEQLAVVGQS